MGGWSSMGGSTGGNVDGMLRPNCLIQVGTASVHQVDVAIHSGRDENMGRTLFGGGMLIGLGLYSCYV